MSKSELVMALDQGTTSSRALVFDLAAKIIAGEQQDFEQIYPHPGWVEHDPEAIWSTVLATAQSALKQAEPAHGAVAAIGITNQRETIVIWDLETGKPINNAIVWQDRRTAEVCQQLRDAGHEPMIRQKTGLLLDPYFSATKIAWLLDHVDGARERAASGKLACGTIDTFMIWRLTGGVSHVTDETNAARTCLFNIHTGEWDDDLLALFNVPQAILPEIKISAANFGSTDPSLFGRAIPITGVAGDQQAASFGQGCTQPGMTKATYGTGCFVLMNTGNTPVLSENRLLTTRACRTEGDPVFALEGSIFIAGAAAQWLRDELQIIATSGETEALASSMTSNDGVYMVPAFAGLGAPHWDSEARGSLFGMTRQTGRAAITRAVLESVAYQTLDLTHALSADGGAPELIRVDGGMSQNNWLMQFISDVTECRLERPANVESTALGAALLAGMQAGIWSDRNSIAGLKDAVTTFSPDMPAETRTELTRGWKNAVAATRHFADLQNG